MNNLKLLFKIKFIIIIDINISKSIKSILFFCKLVIYINFNFDISIIKI